MRTALASVAVTIAVIGTGAPAFADELTGSDSTTAGEISPPSAEGTEGASEGPDEEPSEIVAASPAAGVDPQCFGDRYGSSSTDADRAAALMQGELTLTGFGSATLPADPDWHENPFGSAVWVADYHTLRWADVLRREGLRTGDQAMLDRYAGLLQDWLTDNAYGAPRVEDLSWSALRVGVRAIGLVCAESVLGKAPWLQSAIADHARALLDPAQRGRGNHGLHQDMGLLALGCHLGNSVWKTQALARAGEDLGRLVDPTGVSREGSLQYHQLVFRWYRTLEARAQACGIALDTGFFSRIGLMPNFVAQATQPDGTVVAWGDSQPASAAVNLGASANVLEYALSQGLRGVLPDRTFALYQQGGYAFSRSGWFDTESADQQSLASIRFGPPMDSTTHGHEDAGAISWYAGGGQLLWQPGLYGYYGGAARRYVRSNEAHNTVDIEGATYDRSVGGQLLDWRSSGDYDLVRVRTRALSGAVWTRTLVHFKAQHLLLVDDQVEQAETRTVTQNWQFGTDREVATGSSFASTEGTGTDAAIVWAGAAPTLSVVKGQTDPLLGWRSEAVNEFTPAPTLLAGATGTAVRLTAIVVPVRDGEDPDAAVESTTDGADGVRSIVLRVGQDRWTLTFGTRTATITQW